MTNEVYHNEFLSKIHWLQSTPIETLNFNFDFDDVNNYIEALKNFAFQREADVVE